VNANERKTVLVVRRTRLDELVARYHTLSQARFYIEHLGADFGDYLRESAAYAAALQAVVQALEARGRYQIVDRALVPNFVFGADDIVVALGQDGMVANTMKYLDGQPLIGVNPEPARWDGLLLPFAPADLAALLAPDILPQFTADEMAARGVQLPGSGAAHQGPLALVKLENGAQGQPLYIAGTENFYAITRYNWSSYYALSVIELGQEVAAAMGR